MAIERVASASPYAEPIGFSAAVRAGDVVFVAGTTALDASGELVGGDDPHAQTLEALRKVGASLAAVGARLDPGGADAHPPRPRERRAGGGRAHGEVFGAVRPAAAMVVSGLLHPRMRVEIEAVVHAPAPRAAG